MIDAVAAAASAVGFITPALVEIGKGSAKKLGDTAAEKLLAWLRTKTTGPAQEALTDLEREPLSPDNQADLRKRLAKLLEQNPVLLEEMHALLPVPAASGDRMEQHVHGDGAKGLQIKGSGNTSTM
jgi:hypothetical protein